MNTIPIKSSFISIIIVNHNGLPFTQKCIESLYQFTTSRLFEIIVVDNNSRDGSVEAIKTQYPKVKVIALQQNIGFGKANNVGASVSIGEYLFFVNNDTIFKEDIILHLGQFLQENHTCGAVGPLLLNSDGSYQHSYGKFPSLINELRTKRDATVFKDIPKNRSPKQVDWVSFAAVMIRRSAFEKINGFDDRYFMYFEDADLCFRLQNAGFQIYYCAEYSLIHIGGGSRSQEVATMIKTEYRHSQLLFYALHRSGFESLALRLYLFLRFLYPFLCTRGEEHRQARLVITMAIFSYAYRS